MNKVKSFCMGVAEGIAKSMDRLDEETNNLKAQKILSITDYFPPKELCIFDTGSKIVRVVVYNE